MTARYIDALFARLTDWAASDPRIVGLAIVGSHARGTARQDSDVDVLVLTDAASAFFEDDSWLARFGVAKRLREEAWGRVRTLRVWIEEGAELELDFTDPSWASQPLDEGTHRVVAGGMRVLLDRTGALSALLWE